MGKMLVSDIFLAMGLSLAICLPLLIVGYVGSVHINRRRSGWYHGKI